MGKTIELFRTEHHDVLRKDEISSIARRPEALAKPKQRILETICKVFATRLKFCFDIPIECHSRPMVFPNQTIGYGGSVVIPNPEIMPSPRLKEFEDICYDEARSLLEVSDLLQQLHYQDELTLGQTNSSDWFKSVSSGHDDAHQAARDLATGLRRMDLYEAQKIELKLHDGSSVTLKIPPTTHKPIRSNELEKITLEIRSSTLQTNTLDAFCNGDAKLTTIAFSANDATKTRQAYYNGDFLEAEVYPIYHHRDGKLVIDSYVLEKIVGLSKNQTLSIF